MPSLPGPTRPPTFTEAIRLFMRRLHGEAIQDICCPACFYPAEGLKTSTCPECGYDLQTGLLHPETAQHLRPSTVLLVTWNIVFGVWLFLLILEPAMARLIVPRELGDEQHAIRFYDHGYHGGYVELVGHFGGSATWLGWRSPPVLEEIRLRSSNAWFDDDAAFRLDPVTLEFAFRDHGSTPPQPKHGTLVDAEPVQQWLASVAPDRYSRAGHEAGEIYAFIQVASTLDHANFIRTLNPMPRQVFRHNARSTTRSHPREMQPLAALYGWLIWFAVWTSGVLIILHVREMVEKLRRRTRSDCKLPS